jgi:hypothetical protein
METTMTDATIALAGMAELADKGPDVDMLRQMVQFMAQRLMDMDVESRCAALATTRRAPSGSTAATASETDPGRRAPARWR